jgi:putative endonuclease
MEVFMPKLNIDTPRGKVGKIGEDIAEDYLFSHGFGVIARNYESKLGELDMIVHHPGLNLICFVEVKCRRTTTYGVPQLSISKKKQRTIWNCAQLFLIRERGGLLRGLPLDESTNYRFDVVAILLGGGCPGIEHIEGAFYR